MAGVENGPLREYRPSWLRRPRIFPSASLFLLFFYGDISTCPQAVSLFFT